MMTEEDMMKVRKAVLNPSSIIPFEGKQDQLRRKEVTITRFRC